jgi:hypothetical protein
LFGENVSIIIESKVEQKVMKHSAIDVEYIWFSSCCIYFTFTLLRYLVLNKL